MKKFLSLFLLTIIVPVILTGCGKEIGITNINNHPDVNEYFPIAENLYWEYEGIGNEYAGGRVDTEFISNNRVQFSRDNIGTVVAEVFEIDDEGIKLINSFLESYFRISYLDKEPAEETYLLKAPVVNGNKWRDGEIEWVIESVDEKIKVPVGEFACVKVVGRAEDMVIERYFAKGVGLVKQKYVVNKDFIVEENLAKFGNAEKDNCLPEKQLEIYYPSENADKLVKDVVIEKFRTNETLAEKITARLKDKKVLGKNVKLLNVTRVINMDKGEEILRLNFSRELVTEMNAGSGYEALLIDSIVNTYGKNFGVDGVIINVEGKGYESGHFAFERDEVIKVSE